MTVASAAPPEVSDAVLGAQQESQAAAQGSRRARMAVGSEQEQDLPCGFAELLFPELELESEGPIRGGTFVAGSKAGDSASDREFSALSPQQRRAWCVAATTDPDQILSVLRRWSAVFGTCKGHRPQHVASIRGGEESLRRIVAACGSGSVYKRWWRLAQLQIHWQRWLLKSKLDEQARWKSWKAARMLVLPRVHPLDESTDDGMTCAHFAAMHGNLACLLAVREMRIGSFGMQNATGKLWPHLAARHNHISCLDECVWTASCGQRRGVSHMSLKDNSGANACHVAAQYGRAISLRWVFESKMGAALCASDHHGFYPSHHAAESGNSTFFQCVADIVALGSKYKSQQLHVNADLDSLSTKLLDLYPKLCSSLSAAAPVRR